ncbi:MAG: metal-sensitive transcriptional regulator [Proteobacteria bacterium]|nr:metal-sensitive transcriptional regulator [Pseudomonadota bacterium]
MNHLHREPDKKALILRLKRIEGQIRGLQRLVEEDAPCDSVAQQLSAARRALDKAFHSMVGCLIESRLGSKGRTPADIKQALEILSRYS